MIITGLLSVLVSLLSFLLSPLPSLPSLDSLGLSVADLLVFFESGISFLSCFCDWNIISSLVDVWLAIFTFYHGYQFIMFVLRKIPMLGIE